ncbi:hypothetical protein OIU77_031518 [Salix suchowensis]|uniref:Uncharacterized protein n=1 Tax=Salix suchowensis TaxID=1278906 RepID=A0ABQ9BFP4_9ROSI|nr:hypothetical protein OIU77_031518 [Salix suchowensis]
MWMEQLRQRNCAVSEMTRHSMSNFVHPTTRVSDDFKLMYNSFVEPFLSLKLYSGKTEIPYLARRLCTHSDGSIIWGSTLLFEIFFVAPNLTMIMDFPSPVGLQRKTSDKYYVNQGFERVDFSGWLFMFIVCC